MKQTWQMTSLLQKTYSIDDELAYKTKGYNIQTKIETEIETEIERKQEHN